MTDRKTFLQQSALALAGSCLPFSKLFAETKHPFSITAIDTQHPKDCSKDLRNPLFTSDILYADFDYGKSPNIIKDILYKSEDASQCVTTPPSADICDDTNHHDTGFPDPGIDVSVLRYRAYYRKSSYKDTENGHDYDAAPLPCVVLFNPGGFAECSYYLSPGLVVICEQLAMRGYIAITADYRKGRLKDTTAPGRVTAQQQLASYRALQDGRGAIRSIIKRNRGNKHGSRFKINEDQFFVGGLSAGAIVALGIAYYRNQTKVNNCYPVEPTSLTIEQALGHMNADYYYGESGDDLTNPN